MTKETRMARKFDLFEELKRKEQHIATLESRVHQIKKELKDLIQTGDIDVKL